MKSWKTVELQQHLQQQPWFVLCGSVSTRKGEIVEGYRVEDEGRRRGGRAKSVSGKMKD